MKASLLRAPRSFRSAGREMLEPRAQQNHRPLVKESILVVVVRPLPMSVYNPRLS